MIMSIWTVMGGIIMGEGLTLNAQRSTLNAQRPMLSVECWMLNVERWALTEVCRRWRRVKDYVSRDCSNVERCLDPQGNPNEGGCSDG